MNYLKTRTAIMAVLLCPTLFARAQNTLDKAGLGAGVNASAAYSFRRLSSSYGGKSINIRRSSDNATQDIGFTAGGELDTASLISFVGANSGYITTWYDQSGNGVNLTQSTAGNQPVLVNAGIINRENARPFARFWGFPHVGYNSLVLPSAMTTVGHVSSVMKFATGGYGFLLSSSGSYNWHSNPGVNLFYTFASTSVQNAAAWSNGSSYSPLAMPWPASLSLEEVEPQTPSSGTGWDNIGMDRGVCCHVISGGGGYSELLLFAAALPTASRLALETNQLSYFGLVTLPVTGLSFTARADNGKAYLSWQTATEHNSRDFTVDHSTDGYSWTPLATLPAAGNSSTPRDYRYIDYSPQPGDNYYRIARTDDDGKTEYSPVAAVRCTTAGQTPAFQLLQNPVSAARLSLRVNIPVTLSILSMDGKAVWKGRLDAGVREIDLDGCPKGLYLVSAGGTTVQLVLK